MNANIVQKIFFKKVGVVCPYLSNIWCSAGSVIKPPLKERIKYQNIIKYHVEFFKHPQTMLFFFNY